jgi:hypothetical protein
MVCTLQIEEVEMGKTRIMHGRGKKCVQNLVRKYEGRRPLVIHRCRQKNNTDL